jgi:deoxyribonuclease V
MSFIGDSDAMKITPIHPWQCEYGEAIAIQNALREKLVLTNDGLPEPIRTVAGADISYAKASNLFFAAVILLDFETMAVIEESAFIDEAAFPYIPGLLSFREGPALLAAFEKLNGIPDVVLFDGQGIAHPRGIGLASHMGLILDLPAIGCAKSRLCGSHDAVGENIGAFSPLIFKEQICGAALRTKARVKPVFVSPGHRIGLSSAIAVTLGCCRGYRLPEPTRKAHLLVNKIRKEYV